MTNINRRDPEDKWMIVVAFISLLVIIAMLLFIAGLPTLFR